MSRPVEAIIYQPPPLLNLSRARPDTANIFARGRAGWKRHPGVYSGSCVCDSSSARGMWYYVKSYLETDVRNRPSGIRVTCRLSKTLPLGVKRA
jgi:hypothetical protein